jgi:hypothetical protein
MIRIVTNEIGKAYNKVSKPRTRYETKRTDDFMHCTCNNTEDDEGYDIHNITEIYKQLEGHDI